MKKIISTLALLLAALFLVSCSSNSTATVSNLDAAVFSQKVAETGVVTLDVRTPFEFMVGHIPGAINIDVEGLQFNSEIEKLDKNLTYAVYCRSGRRSIVAIEAMQNVGFNSLFNLTNGINDWQAQNLPLETS